MNTRSKDTAVVAKLATGGIRNGTHTNGKPPAPAMKLLDAGISLADLMRLDLPDPKYVIPGVLPEGVNLFGGRPKLGKSWWALYVSMGVASGMPMFGAPAVQRRPVLCLCLEDTRRRLKDRAGKILKATGWLASPDLDLRTSWPRADDGGLAALGEWMSDHKGGMVVVDTLAKFRDRGKKGTQYELDYQAVAGIKGVVDLYAGAGLVLTHTRKLPGDDPFDEISGTLGLTGAADTIFVLDRRRGQNNAALFIGGRDMPETTLNMEFDPATCLWSVVGRGDGIERGEVVTKVSACEDWVVRYLGKHSHPDKELMAAAEKAGFTVGNMKQAKKVLRGADPLAPARLSSRSRGFSESWWCWIGPQNQPRPDRPDGPTLIQSNIQNVQNDQNGESPNHSRHSRHSEHATADDPDSFPFGANDHAEPTRKAIAAHGDDHHRKGAK